MLISMSVAQLGDQCQDFCSYTDIQKVQATLLQ